MKNSLGKRIAIIGPSNSGKSTLAEKIGKAFGIPILHLDQIAHKPGTSWERVSELDLIEAQDQFLIKNNTWVIEGNYSVCMSQRFGHAETLIWCDPPLIGCIGRYIIRSIKSDPDRVGRLKDAKHEFSLALIKYTIFNYPKNRSKYLELIQMNSHLNCLHMRTFSEIKNLIF
ncbi:MAG: adenylate kinase [Micavibrio aeruginosavorus]|uniref:Adenylate kinase n=1 Tax=Micavibrio aeruginosavorus TaxID=349221 RepID=A0A2W5HMN1_9BACT|nr:MAG: adenylate kinase [Micavibrio aeruginosavorus]